MRRACSVQRPPGRGAHVQIASDRRVQAHTPQMALVLCWLTGWPPPPATPGRVFCGSGGSLVGEITFTARGGAAAEALLRVRLHGKCAVRRDLGGAECVEAHFD